jgi:sec-independent protein translocase protein TatA
MMIYALQIAGSEWFIIILAIIIILVPSKITNISKTIGKLMGEYEKAKNTFMNEKNDLFNTQSLNHPIYKGPAVQRPISSDREKLEIIARSLNIDTENKSDDELRNLISGNLK